MIQISKAGIGNHVGSRFFILCSLILLLTLNGCKRGEQEISTALTWQTQDGFTQQASLYSPKQENPPAMILVHSYGGRRGDWEPLALRAVQRGYMVLAYDIRGHGDSAMQNGKSRRHNQFTREDWKRTIADIGIAKKQLLANGASPDNLFLVGSSIGANLAVLYGDSDSDIQGVILLSPGIEYKGINIENTVKENRRLPLLLMAAEGDRYSANSIEKMSVWSPSYTELRTYSGTSHGTDLLLRSDQITNDMFGWLKPILK